MPTLLPSQACKELGICRRTLLKFESRGVLRPKKLEPLGWRVYRRSDVEALKSRLTKDRKPGLPVLNHA